MLYEILKHIRNFFPEIWVGGSYTIDNGNISLPFVSDGQYFLIEGSKFNDGVYLYPIEEPDDNTPAVLKDETFVGEIAVLNIPKEFLDLVEEIETWNANNVPSAYTSESFGGYSYQKATNKSGVSVSWKEVFASRLNSWRKL